MEIRFTARTPLSPDELLIAQEIRDQKIAEEIGYLVQRGMPLEKARRWAAVNVFQGISNKPHAIVQYAMPEHKKAEAMALFAESLGKYYADCASRYGQLGGVWVGD